MRFRDFVSPRAAGALALGALVLSMSAGRDSQAVADPGTTRVLCGRTLWVAPHVGRTVGDPGNGQSVVVPIGFVTYADWNAEDVASCAQPVDASVEFSITARANGAGIPIVIGPVQGPAVATPTAPGVQGWQHFDLVIPPGTFQPDTFYECVVDASYEVDFQPNAGFESGFGRLQALGQTNFVLTPCSEQNPERARLLLLRVDGGDGPFTRVRTAQQACEFFVLCNNDASESVTVDLVARSFQQARTPDNLDIPGDRGLFSVGDPDAGTDAFPVEFDSRLPFPAELDDLSQPFAKDQSFTDDLSTTQQLLGLPNPGKSSDQATKKLPVTLGPGEITMVPVCARAYESANDGSVCVIEVEADGQFNGGDTARASAGGVMVVDNSSRQRQALFTVTDSIASGWLTRAVFSEAIYDNDPGRSTHGEGNLVENDPLHPDGPGFQVCGPKASLAAIDPEGFFGQFHDDSFSTASPPKSVEYTVKMFHDLGSTASPRRTIRVILRGLDVALAREGSVTIPSPTAVEGSSDVRLEVDLAADEALITDGSRTVFRGPFSLFRRAPTRGYQVNNGETRTFTLAAPAFAQPERPIVLLTHPAGAATTTPGSGDATVFIDIADGFEDGLRHFPSNDPGEDLLGGSLGDRFRWHATTESSFVGLVNENAPSVYISDPRFAGLDPNDAGAAFILANELFHVHSELAIRGSEVASSLDDPTVGWVFYSSSGLRAGETRTPLTQNPLHFNQPVSVPVAARRGVNDDDEKFKADSASIRMRYTNRGSGRDVVKLDLTVPVDQGFDPSGQILGVDVGGYQYSFVLGQDGAIRNPDGSSARVKVLGTGEARVTLKIRRARLGGALANEGFRPRDLNRTGWPSRVETRVVLGNEVYRDTLPMLASARRNGRIRAVLND